LRRVRRAVAEWAARAGLRGQRAGDFVIAVHEIAANAVRHGSPLARLVLQIAGGTVAQAEICDSGHWPAGAPAAPAPGESGGRGLPLARQVCDQVTIRRGAGGSTVTLQMSLPARDAARPGWVPGDGSAHLPAAGNFRPGADIHRLPGL
jgi:anti-sigma regulatory factor (Ser/Thr protein kinase)